MKDEWERGRITHLSLLRQTVLSWIQDYHCQSPKALHNWPCCDYSFVGAREKEQAAYGFADMCDLIIYSHEVGLAKPDPSIFALTCERLGVQPHEMIFLDDVAGHIAAANDFGIHGIQFHTNTQAIADIEGKLASQHFSQSAL